MKSFSRKIGAVCGLVLIALFVGSMGTGALVLCFGEDGHIALEALPLGNCNPSSSNDSKTTSSFAMENLGDGCGPCVDVSIVANTPDKQITSVDKRLSNPLPAGFLITSIPAIADHPLSANTIFDLGKNRLFSSAHFLRTVILQV